MNKAESVIKEAIEAEEFYFKKGQDVAAKWQNINLDSGISEKLIRLSNQYQTLLTEKENDSFLDHAVNILFEIISYSDTHAKEKSTHNKYEDNRALAKAGVRMGNWIEQLIALKLTPEKVKIGSVQNAYNYLLDPQNNAPILSEKHRALVSTKLFKKPYDRTTFISDLKAHYSGENLKTKNPANYTYVLSQQLYIEKDTWQESKTITEKSTSSEVNTQQQYWLFAPGEKAKKWDTFYQNGEMAIGWTTLGDLKKYTDKVDIENKLLEGSDKGKRKYNDALACYEFASVIKEGDIVIAKRGKREYVGWGIVTSDYFFDDTKQEYQHRRKVHWKSNGEWHDQEGDIVTKTLTDITKYPHYVTRLEKLLGIKTKTLDHKNKNNYPLNTIFYGPPGTGKTYNTILRAAEIIENRKIENHEEARKIFNENLHDQIEFITFHQNYSYEDFIQGLRPDIENNNSLVFDRTDGVFAKMATNALFEFFKKLQQVEKENPQVDLNESYLDFVEFLKITGNKAFTTVTGLPVSIESFTKNENIEFKHDKSSKTYIVSGQRLIKLYKSYPQINDIKNVNNDIRDAIGGCNATMYWVALKEFISFLESREPLLSEDSSPEDRYDEINYETKKKLLATTELSELRKVPKDSVRNYVIIIDEINRANISRVFGELITLIEPDKRSHGELPLQATLPSGESFVVPSNLYIIGTMNTADKSIALLDIALRRRFDFESMYPKYEIDGKPIFEAEILRKINHKIREEKGEDFQIGHSYFMGEENKDLNSIMNNKVVPLLMEYFMNDKKDVTEILEHAGLQIDKDSWPWKITGKK